MQRSVRIVHQKFKVDAFSGEGARLNGGRWNTSGLAVVYTANNEALAMLEMLVYITVQDLLKGYVLFELNFPDEFITDVSISHLPANWRDFPAPSALRILGDKWIRSKQSAVLRVPSAVAPNQYNYLINPHHVDFKNIKIGKPEAIQFDPRLLKS